MCGRNTTDVLVRRFLDDYKLNLLALPGRRVTCGSVYVQQGKRVTAPGLLADILEPAITLPNPYSDEPMPDLTGTWSDTVSVAAGIGLLRNFLAALGAVGLIDELTASVTRARVRTVQFRFGDVTRDSISPTGLGAALTGRRLVAGNPWVRAGNRYFAVAAVVWSTSISVQGQSDAGTAVNLGAGLATVADAHAKVEVDRHSDTELVYNAQAPLAIAVELYELRWDDADGQLYFQTPKGPVSVLGATGDDAPEPVLLDNEEDALLTVTEE